MVLLAFVEVLMTVKFWAESRKFLNHEAKNPFLSSGHGVSVLPS